MKYSQSTIELIRSMYCYHTAKEIAESMGISITTVYNLVYKHGIKKPKEWIVNPKSGGFKKGERNSPGTEFKKGQTAHNKGKKVEPHVYKSLSRTFFPPGHVPFNNKPMYSISVRADSGGIPYKFIKIRPQYWELLHRYMWMEAHGPIPKNMVVIFKDGNSLNCQLSNLDMITRQENMLRNSSNNVPEHLKEVVKLKNKLTKKIKEHGKKQTK